MEKRQIYDDGELYDIQNSFDRDDIDFYKQIVRKYGDPVLELACGTGVLTIPIAKERNSITGLDLSKEMLRQGIKKAEGIKNIEFVNENMTDFNLGKKFKTIFLGFNSVCHLFSYFEITNMLTCVKNHLESNGVFVLDCFIPSAKYLCRDENTHYPVIDERGLKITETNKYDSIEQINHIKWFYEYEGEKWIEDLDMRMFYPQEIQNYIKINGMKIIEMYGDHDFGEFSDKNRFQIYVCKK